MHPVGGCPVVPLQPLASMCVLGRTCVVEASGGERRVHRQSCGLASNGISA